MIVFVFTKNVENLWKNETIYNKYLLEGKKGISRFYTITLVFTFAINHSVFISTASAAFALLLLHKLCHTLITLSPGVKAQKICVRFALAPGG